VIKDFDRLLPAGDLKTLGSYLANDCLISFKLGHIELPGEGSRAGQVLVVRLNTMSLYRG
jgi:hypothetical protein